MMSNEVELEPGEPNRKANNDKISEIVRRHTQANEGVPSGLWSSLMIKELQDHLDSVVNQVMAYADDKEANAFNRGTLADES